MAPYTVHTVSQPCVSLCSCQSCYPQPQKLSLPPVLHLVSSLSSGAQVRHHHQEVSSDSPRSSMALLGHTIHWTLKDPKPARCLIYLCISTLCIMPGTQQVHNKALKNRGAQNEWASKSECNCPLAKVMRWGNVVGRYLFWWLNYTWNYLCFLSQNNKKIAESKSIPASLNFIQKHPT